MQPICRQLAVHVYSVDVLCYCRRVAREREIETIQSDIFEGIEAHFRRTANLNPQLVSSHPPWMSHRDEITSGGANVVHIRDRPHRAIPPGIAVLAVGNTPGSAWYKYRTYLLERYVRGQYLD